MESSTNRFPSPLRSSGDGTTSRQNSSLSVHTSPNSRNAPDDRPHEQSRPNALVPPTILQPSTRETYQTRKRSAPSSIASSRETSPVSRLARPNQSRSTSRSVSRSRNNSLEPSPTRSSNGTSTKPLSAQSVQKSLDVNKPQLPPPVKTSPELPKTTKSSVASKTEDTPLLSPNSPLPPTSIPRNNLYTGSSKREQEGPLANAPSKKQRTKDSDIDTLPEKQLEESEENQLRNTTRNLPRVGSVLETVEEAGTPTISTIDLPTSDEKREPVKRSGESGSDSGEKKPTGLVPENKRENTSAPSRTSNMIPKRSFTSLNSARGKSGETSTTNMIVETETVSSVPQVSLAGGAADRGGIGTIRLRPSDETIRPKREKKKQARRAAVPAGTMSSKADVFEAKVASAVDDVDSSDSEETFVYESNPPDPHPSRQHRYHSRTPSAASMVSQLDQYGRQSRPGLRDGLHGISGKRSMKFTNTYNTFDGEISDHGGGRGSSRTNGHLHNTRHHHGNRHGKNGGAASLFDQARFFSSQGTKSLKHVLSNGNGRHQHFNMKKDGDTYGYDFDAEGADDERAPLVGNGRGIRSRHGRRPNSSSLRQMEYMEQRRRSCFVRYGMCALIMIFAIVFGAGGTLFLVGVTKPLYKVYANSIQNVLASEQQIMLDLDIQATNPNIFALTISDLDVVLFAKSRYVGSESFSTSDLGGPKSLPRTAQSKARARKSRVVDDIRRRRTEGEVVPRAVSAPISTTGVDEGTDPMPEEPVGDPQTMILGRVFYFYSPLTYEPSPWNLKSSNSTGQIRLSKPGNRTEEGGSLRWERVLQHPFELIVRGIVKYQLPLSSTTRSASVSSKVKYIPDKGDNDNDNDDDDNDANRTKIVSVR